MVATATATTSEGVENLHDAFLRCRTFGHAWSEFDPEGGVDWHRDHWRITLRCDHCRTERYDVLDWRGDVLTRNYWYPDGYKQAGLPRRADFRMELYRRKNPRRKLSAARR